MNVPKFDDNQLVLLKVARRNVNKIELSVLGFILWGPGISVGNLTAIHPCQPSVCV